eukprot:CAMPEP_0181116112 /NCGR_PEP_ID=MMETSP1071-20121207/21778_1 /TAXON_ID=35127 /ORGANISM="Thalassiosira sp., Strain NH16" /LENGTH=74 /DNA_ID=CAMNT_0023200337 /DNA_START=211 /DNA_END=435 /DNA_ORIENTATION=-
MGACLSSGKGHLEQVDDSVHVMLAHDRKKRKESGNAAPSGYKPRAINPALERKKEEGAAGTAAEEKTEETANGD